MWTLLPVDPGFATRLLDAAKASDYRPAGIGGNAALQATYRSDSISWLDRSNGKAAEEALDFLAGIQTELQQFFRLHIEKFECHFSIYQPGQFYVRHSDVAARSTDGTSRIFSFVIYLNPEWGKNDGGELRGFEDDQVIFEITPQLGSMILFRSELEHEVLPAHRTRYALTGWFRK